MPMTDYLRGKLYDHVLRNTSYTPPATLYMELCTSATVPTSASAGTPSGAGRVAVTFADDGGDGSGAASAGVTFSDAAAATYRYAEIWDASTSGNRLFYRQLVADVVLGAPGNVVFNAADITATFT